VTERRFGCPRQRSRSSPRSVRRCWPINRWRCGGRESDRESAYEDQRSRAAAVAEAASNPNGGRQASESADVVGLNDMPFGSTGRVAQ
jgi:hypothetical protein